MAGEALGFWPKIGTPALGLAIFWLLWRKAKSGVKGYHGIIIWAFLLLGFGLQCFISPDSLRSKLSKVSFLAKVDGPVRRPNPGGVSLALRIISTLEEPGSQKLVGKRVLCKAVELPWKNIDGVREGDYLQINASFYPIVRTENPFSYSATLWRHGFSARCKIRAASERLAHQSNSFESLRELIFDRSTKSLGNNERAGLVLSMGFGFDDMLSADTEAAFRATGLTHLLVFSGYQVVVFALSVYFLLMLLVRALFRLRPAFFSMLATHLSLRSLAMLASILVSAVFVCVAGLQPSSVRAVTASFLGAGAFYLERGGGFFCSIIVSLFILCLIWPACFFEPGVDLTYAALIGIFLGSAAKRSPIYCYLAVNYYVWVLTSIVTLAWFDFISPLGIIFNLVLAPIASFIACNLGLFALFVHLLGLDQRAFMLQAVSYLLIIFRDLVCYLATFRLSGFEPELITRLALICLLVIYALRRMKKALNHYMRSNNLARTSL